jgi:hypothetical protein
MESKKRVYISNDNLDESFFVRNYMNRVIGKNCKDHDDVFRELLHYYKVNEKIDTNITEFKLKYHNIT